MMRRAPAHETMLQHDTREHKGASLFLRSVRIRRQASSFPVFFQPLQTASVPPNQGSHHEALHRRFLPCPERRPGGARFGACACRRNPRRGRGACRIRSGYGGRGPDPARPAAIRPAAADRRAGRDAAGWTAVQDGVRQELGDDRPRRRAGADLCGIGQFPVLPAPADCRPGRWGRHPPIGGGADARFPLAPAHRGLARQEADGFARPDLPLPQRPRGGQRR